LHSIGFLIAALAGICALPALAQQAYPSKPITIGAGHRPGSDVALRWFGEHV
jgi:tripartite-type tricarboxylate transporter receptor subunit TctC